MIAKKIADRLFGSRGKWGLIEPYTLPERMVKHRDIVEQAIADAIKGKPEKEILQPLDQLLVDEYIERHDDLD